VKRNPGMTFLAPAASRSAKPRKEMPIAQLKAERAAVAGVAKRPHEFAFELIGSVFPVALHLDLPIKSLWGAVFDCRADVDRFDLLSPRLHYGIELRFHRESMQMQMDTTDPL
jgi:hypothetical protein